jgi:hypothetical protein
MSNLTKTSYLIYSQCAKAFWLTGHQPHLAAPPDPASQRRLRAGQEVDKLARAAFANGRLIPYRPDPQAMAELTAQAISEGSHTLFQATFAPADLLVKVDILTQAVVDPPAAGWHLIEVKSSTSYKPEEHLPDVAFQVYVLQQAGLTVTQASVMHLNRDYRHHVDNHRIAGHDDDSHPDRNDLFRLTDITEEVLDCLPQVAEAVAHMRQTAVLPHSPEVSIGRHCKKPNQCPFHDHCWQDVSGWTIYDIPYLKRPQEQKLEAAGIRYVTDIPPDFSLGHKRANAFVARVKEAQIEIEREAIQARLDELVFPLYFFDFETIDYAVPIYDGCKPYQQAPFQYSCHILTDDGSLTHTDYLHTTADDPRRPLVESLLDHIGPTGHLVAYNISFERRILQQLAHQFPEYGDRLLDMANRLWDQLAIFRQHYQHHGFARSNSLKAVLPVVVPQLSYRSLAVQNGMEAQVVWEEMLACTDAAEKQRMVTQLRNYCHLDTLAMVKIHQALSSL